MLKSYIKIAWRTITRHKLYSLINVLGLGLGMTCCLFIFLWVKDEKSMDNFHTNGKNLYVIYETVKSNGRVTEANYTTPIRSYAGRNIPSFLLDGMKEAIPEVVHTSYYATGYDLPWGHPETIQVGDKILKLEGSRASDDFFTMFSYPLVVGNPATALRDLHDIAISRKMAGLFFGSPQNAIGKTLRYENNANFTVQAVFEDLPRQSTLHFDFLLNWEAQKRLAQWSSNDLEAFVELSDDANPVEVEAKLNSFLQTRLDKTIDGNVHLGLQRFGDKYLHSTFVDGKPVTGRIEYVRIFSGVAIFILLIACINFMNLATARSVKRAKEVGLRKVVGSTRRDLIGQFLGESLVFSFMAMLVSIVLLMIFLPSFNYFTEKHISLQGLGVSFWTMLVGIMLLTGLVAGSYPALYLSSLQPVKVLKGIFRFTQSAVWFRKGLTVFQFVLSIVLLIATIVIVRQTSYTQNSNLGYNRENLLYIRIEGTLSKIDKYLLFKQRALGMPGIAMVDRSSETPHEMNFVANPDAMNWEGKNKGERVGFKPASVGFDFVKIMNLHISEGRDFSPLNATDSSDGFLVNEEAVRQMGMKQPLGKWVSAWAKKGHIIGVLKDYHSQSLREPILPVMIDVKEYEYFGVILVKTKPGQTREALASLEKVYKEINPQFAFACQFVDEEYKKLYSSELIISKLSVAASTLAIIISCLGLLGLVMFAAEQRTREIGIRKVLGASLGQILVLFSHDFLSLILIAFLIASPLGWYLMNSWLRDFAYRITISWWVFALAGLVALAVALITVSYQALKAGMANPVRALRSE